jgi:hypothetical protein
MIILLKKTQINMPGATWIAGSVIFESTNGKNHVYFTFAMFSYFTIKNSLVARMCQIMECTKTQTSHISCWLFLSVYMKLILNNLPFHLIQK